MATLLRVINQQTIPRANAAAGGSILLDKIDRSQGNFESGITYAQQAKQKLYVPYVNPLDPNVKGYIDLVKTDAVLLQAGLASGVITKLVAKGYITTTAFASSLTATPTVTSGSDGAGTLTIGGTTFLSLAPDLTYVTLTNPSTGATQTIAQANFATQSNTVITIANATVTIGVPATTWKISVFANSKRSNTFTMP